jgi:hypothetical protein
MNEEVGILTQVCCYQDPLSSKNWARRVREMV